MAVTRRGNSTKQQDTIATDPDVQVPPTVTNPNMATQPPRSGQPADTSTIVFRPGDQPPTGPTVELTTKVPDTGVGPHVYAGETRPVVGNPSIDEPHVSIGSHGFPSSGPGGPNASEIRSPSCQSNDSQIVLERAYGKADQFQGLPREKERRDNVPLRQDQSRPHSGESYPNPNEDSATSHPSVVAYYDQTCEPSIPVKDGRGKKAPRVPSQTDLCREGRKPSNYYHAAKNLPLTDHREHQEESRASSRSQEYG
uniref:Uncharacterized protein n=1 Tax=Cannabis sativa TaxID=3483 RepID=A0A803NL09_CANSA